MFKKILFPVNFSSSCAAMATCVKRTAAILDSEVTLVHVCDIESHNGFELYLRSCQEIAEEHWAIGQRKLDSFLACEFPSARCPRVLRSGEAATEIVEVAKTGGFDLIIMPTHAGRFRQTLLGSTTAKVLNDADCPVLTTEHAETLPQRPLGHREWVCALALGPDSERVLRVASRAAAQAGANLSVIHAIDESAPAGRHLNECEQLRLDKRKKEALRRMADLLRTADREVEIRIAVGPVKEMLIGDARESGADVLIIGRRPRFGALGRMQDLTYGLVRDSPVPVLSV